MGNSKIGTAEAICLILGVFVAHTLVAIPRSLLESTKSATIINIIYVGIIALLITFILYKLIKNFPSSDIIDISEYLGGKSFKTIIGIVFIAYFMLSSGILLRNFCECLKIVYYPMTSLIFILLAFIVAICIVLKYKFPTISKVNLIIMPLAVISIIFLFMANIGHFTFENIFPIFGDSLFNTFITGLGNLSAFGGISLIYFIPPYLKEPDKMKKIFLSSIALGAIYLLISVSIILFMFIFLLHTNGIMPLYSAARYIEFGTFFQRLESVFLLIWILQMVCYLTITIKVAMSIFKKVTDIKNDKSLILVFGLLLLSIALLPKDYAVSKFIEDTVYKYTMLSIILILGISILILANIKKKRKKVGAKNE